MLKENQVSGSTISRALPNGTEYGLTYDDIILKPRYSHDTISSEIDLSVTDETGKLNLQLPILCANMDTICESEMACFFANNGGIGVLHRYMGTDKYLHEFRKSPQNTFVSFGCHAGEYERLEKLCSAGARHICIDVAHSQRWHLGEMVKKTRQLVPDACIIAGNVGTYDGAQFLRDSGADLVKVGISAGSACATPSTTGFGVPMVTCIRDCARVDCSIIADGGIRCAGDIAKAIAFGADFVMLGGMFAGTTPTPGDVYEDANGYRYKRFRGMASREAQEAYSGKLHESKTSEGVAMNIPYRTDEQEIIRDIRGGLISAMHYRGATSFSEFRSNNEYFVVTNNGAHEAQPHKLKLASKEGVSN